MKADRLFKWTNIATIWLWLSLFALLPILLVLITSCLENDPVHLVRWQFTLENYRALINPIYFKVFWHSFCIAGLCTLICLCLGYPFAYLLARMQSKYKSLLLFLVIIPFWTSSLIRTYAIISILKAKGLLNTVLLSLGIIHKPLSILYTPSAVIIGLVYSLLPFMILPLYANIEKLDIRFIDAARDLGANTITIFARVILPLTLSGIVGGIVLVFLPAMSMFYIPDILGGAKSLLVGNLIQNEFLSAHNWPLGSAVSMVLTLSMGLLLLIYRRADKIGQQHESISEI
ncbi:spermidine/putrescine ABC transporter membrane protein [Candidatus Rickettsiella viridis]|uniref:Spermidine/putrescine ABC transporter membrane protein n=1 Tax=Candidatus Rickettsiella viridis TaxID=676208 RepID=A0A2Z5UW32_9COXI|nr:spermidine/putrescine ABC transporter permease PotB [Candidatus Rickettsiella viridis]BBB15275.1 spermidine/putrescine ABC transporter membrane protein [Candidatus Rickettsiella viridis]